MGQDDIAHANLAPDDRLVPVQGWAGEDVVAQHVRHHESPKGKRPRLDVGMQLLLQAGVLKVRIDRGTHQTHITPPRIEEIQQFVDRRPSLRSDGAVDEDVVGVCVGSQGRRTDGSRVEGVDVAVKVVPCHGRLVEVDVLGATTSSIELAHALWPLCLEDEHTHAEPQLRSCQHQELVAGCRPLMSHEQDEDTTRTRWSGGMRSGRSSGRGRSGNKKIGGCRGGGCWGVAVHDGLLKGVGAWVLHDYLTQAS